jgi:hypothetical protein
LPNGHKKILIIKLKNRIMEKDHSVTDFNIGINVVLRKEKIRQDHQDLLDRRTFGPRASRLPQGLDEKVERYPSDFMFTLSRDEIMGISQTVISSKIKFSKNVRAFTEKGVACFRLTTTDN